VDHKDALDCVRVLAREVEPVRETDIRQLHKLVLARSSPGEAGRYSQHTRIIAGSRVRLPGSAEVPALMGDLATWLAEAPAGYATAFEAHWRLVAIHPFSAGNGRTARLLMNLLLIRSGYPPVVVAPEHRPDYIDALELGSLTGDPDPYRRLMAERLDAGLDHYLEVLGRDLGAAGAAEPGG
ncbi:MAG TPA: Fic family protein, partial [Geminicoccaceae bacterium]